MMQSVAISTAAFVGTCQLCKEPTTGQFDSDEHADQGYFIMECVNCHAKYRCETHLDTYLGISLWVQPAKKEGSNENQSKSY